MASFLRKNFTLVLAFALPVLLIAVIALSTYLPSLFVSTSYNFLYTLCGETEGPYYDCGNYLRQRYSVENGKLVVHPVSITLDRNNDGKPDFNEDFQSRIFFHDTKKNESREISYDEARLLTLNGLVTSPDGVSVSGHYRGGGGDFLFFGGGRSTYGYYIVKGNSRRKQNLIGDNDRYFTHTFQFIGWVLPGRTE